MRPQSTWWQLIWPRNTLSTVDGTKAQPSHVSSTILD
jgi:hypothetical protein